MTKSTRLCLVLALAITGCSKKDDTAAPTPAPPPQTPPVAVAPAAPAVPVATPAPTAPASVSDLTNDQMTGGIKEALGDGLQAAVAQLGTAGGFMNNPEVKIPLPDQVQTIANSMRAVGQGAMADQFVATMNQAAEQAVPAAASVFADSLKNMTVADAQKILTGPDDAATQYFRQTTQADLTQKFLPIVKQATGATGATATYKQILDKAKSVNPFFSSPSFDLDSYVTSKALDGLFKIVADKEKAIRANPVAQGSDLLKTVFGAIKK